jgi:hypothetical protein
MTKIATPAKMQSCAACPSSPTRPLRSSRPPVEQEAHERREDQDVHGRVLGGHDAQEPRIGCADPPIARTSETVAMIDRGVAQTAKQSAIPMSRYLMNF